MSEKLTKALEFANYRSTLNNQRAVLRARIQNLLTFSFNGGSFKIDQSLIGFVAALIDETLTESVILDSYNNPIMISDLKKFKSDIIMRYNEAVNEYYVEYEKLRKNRSVKKLTGLDDE